MPSPSLCGVIDLSALLFFFFYKKQSEVDCSKHQLYHKEECEQTVALYM
tara:strand:- start:1527 stop:1673 length:147 start_codon:yes stop_codon:yes gene_type:complete